MNPQIDAYAAGLFDGEGNIGAGRTRLAWTIACHTGMTVKAKAVLLAMQQEYGGQIRLHRAATDKWAEAWTWSLHGKDAAAFLRRVLPHLRLKRDVAEVALRMEDIRNSLTPTSPGSDRRRWTQEASDRCEALHAEIKRLNRRGPLQTSSRQPIARLVGERWMSMQSDLFTDTGWAPFSGRFPAWGMTRRGELFELPTPALPTDGPGSSSSLLLTPTTGDGSGGGRTEPGIRGVDRDGSGGLREQVRSLLPTPVADNSRGLAQPGTDFASLPNAVLSLLPTPLASDGEKGGPNQRGGSGDLRLSSAVQLLPTPSVADAMGGHLTRSGSRSDELLLPGVAEALANGDLTDQPSGDGKPSSDDQLPCQLSLDATADPD